MRLWLGLWERVLRRPRLRAQRRKPLLPRMKRWKREEQLWI